MTGFYSIVIIIFCLLIFLKKFLTSSQREPNDNKKYEKYLNKITPDNFKLRPSLLNSNERVFFEQLKIAVGREYDVYPQVQLGAIFQPVKQWNNRGELSRLNKRIDFVLYDKNTQIPKIVIELDGESHSRYKSLDRDQFVGAIFEKFHIPLVRFNNGNYSAKDIKNKLPTL